MRLAYSIFILICGLSRVHLDPQVLLVYLVLQDCQHQMVVYQEKMEKKDQLGNQVLK